MNLPVWRYVYWMHDTMCAQLRTWCRTQNIEPVEAEKNPCEALRGQVGLAAPPTWAMICKFDAVPWYQQSRHVGQTLVTSGQPLPDSFAAALTATITPVDFTPPALPGPDEWHTLVAETTDARMPATWFNFPAEVGGQIVQGLPKLTNDPPASWEELFDCWTAVHLNFLQPRYRAGNEWDQAPYSIADTFRISTCCVQLFNMFDTTEKALLVRPCTGAALLQVMEKNRYYLVRPIAAEGAVPA